MPPSDPVASSAAPSANGFFPKTASNGAAPAASSSAARGSRWTQGLKPQEDGKPKGWWLSAGRAMLMSRLAAMPQLELDRRGRVANYQVVGVDWRSNIDWFHALMNLSWAALLAVLFFVYTLVALLFGALYALQPDSIRGSDNSFADAFYFSVQTLSTAGYGYLSPKTTYSNLLALIESFCGLAFVATFTGLLYSRVSKPKARVAFTKFVVVHDIDGIPTLMIRVANQRSSQILDARAQVSVLMKHPTLEGEVNYQYKTLKLDESSIPIFSGGWRLKHTLSHQSPLFGLNGSNSRELGIFAVQAIVVGTEEVYGTRVFERHTYFPQDIKFEHKFSRMLEEAKTKSGKSRLLFHLERLHHIQALDKPDPAKRLAASVIAARRQKAEEDFEKKLDKRDAMMGIDSTAERRSMRDSATDRNTLRNSTAERCCLRHSGVISDTAASGAVAIAEGSCAGGGTESAGAEASNYQASLNQFAEELDRSDGHDKERTTSSSFKWGKKKQSGKLSA